MKQLRNYTDFLNSESLKEFYEVLDKDIIQPYLKLGATFHGLSITGDQDQNNGPAAYLLIFTLPNDLPDNTTLPTYDDEGTQSLTYSFFGTHYMLIPMPY